MVVLAAWIGAAVNTGWTADHSRSSGVILEAIKRNGAAATLRDLQSSGEWPLALQNIGMGSTAWLEVAVALEKGADGMPGFQLTLAFGQALEHSTEQVLSIASVGPFDIADACGNYGPMQPTDRQKVLDALARREQAVKHVSLKRLEASRKACLQKIDEVRERVKAIPSGDWPRPLPRSQAIASSGADIA